MSPHFSRKLKSFKRNPIVIGCFFVFTILSLLFTIWFVQWQKNQADNVSAGSFVFSTQEVDNTSTIMGRDSAISAIDANTIFISYSDVTNENLRFAKTTDGGSNWTYSDIDTTDAANELDMDALDANNIFVLYTDGDPFNTFNLNLAISSNGGDSWSTSSVRLAQDARNPQIDVLDVNTISIVWWNDNGFFDRRFALSTNGGGSFTEVDPFVSGNGATIGGPFIVDANTMYVFGRNGSTDYYCAKSTNGGASFTETLIETATGSSSQEAAMAGVDANTLYFAYNRPMRIAKTINGCTSFTFVSPTVDANTAFFYDGVAIDANNVFFSGSNLTTDNLYLIYTHDGGTTWTELVVDSGNDYGTKQSISAINANEVFFSYHDQTNGALRFASGVFSAQLLSITPSANALDIAQSSNIVMVFDESMSAATANSTNIPVFGSGPLLSGTYSLSTTTIANDTITFDPTDDFDVGETIEVSITNGLQSLSGLSAASSVSKFTVEAPLGEGELVANANYTGSVGGYGFMCNGDFDGDNDNDLVQTDVSGNAIRYYQNNGDGTFQAGINALTSLSLSADIDCIDGNNDGDLDIIFGTGGGIGIALGNGNGTFQAPTTTSGVSGAYKFDVGDFNGDGYKDVAVSSVSVDEFGVFLNNGSGVFSTPTLFPIGSFESGGITANDFNNDGDLDIANVSDNLSGDQEIYVTLGNGDGTFQAHSTIALTAGTTTGEHFLSADLNGDGDIDLIPFYNHPEFSILIGNGDGTFGAPTTYDLVLPGGACQDASLADMDADGDIDIVAHCNNDNLKIAENDGSGVFSTLDSEPSIGGVYFRGITTGDLNGDGRIDAATFGSGSPTMGVFLQPLPFAVSSVNPTQNAIDIAVDSDIVLVFSDSLDTGTVDVTNLPVFGEQTGRLAGSYSFSTTSVANDTVTFNPTDDFKPGERIDVFVSDNVQSSGATPVIPYAASFVAETAQAGYVFTILPAESLLGGPGEKMIRGDYDNDGDIDLMTGHIGNATFLRNDGSNTYTDGTLPGGGANTNYQLGSSDYDADGDIDLALGDFSDYEIYENNGGFSFGLLSTVGVGFDQTGSMAADFDGDGDIDIVLGHKSDTIRVLTNNGSGTFTSTQTLNYGSDINGGALGDFDNDGDIDTAFISSPGNFVAILTNDGTGTFTSNTIATGNANENIDAGDIDGDGDLDLYVGGAANGKFLINNPTGTFTLGSTLTGGTGSHTDMMFGDIDGDNDLDLVVSRRSDGTSLFSNDGAGNFTLETTIDDPAFDPHGIVLADMDGDGDLDIGQSNRDFSTASVLLNTSLVVDSITPARNAIDIAANSDITIVFNSSLNTGSVSSATLPIFSSGPLLAGAYSFSTTTVANDTVTFNPTNDFSAGDTIEVIVTSGVLSTTAQATTPSVAEFTVAATGGSNTFAPRVDYTISSGAETSVGVELADIDNDGDLDLFSGAGSDLLALLTNDGAGNFGSQQDFTTTGSNVFSVESADFNNDGFIDIVTANGAGDDISVFLNNTSGSLNAPTSYSAGNLPWAVTTSDYNGDGFIDIAVTHNFLSQGLRVFINNGNGTFAAAVTYTLNERSESVVSGDVDEDGDIDIVSSNGATQTVSVFLNNGNGTFATKVDYSLTTGLSAGNVDLGDVNNDGRLDIILGDGANNLVVFLNAGSGAFGAAQTTTINDDVKAGLLGDFDGDGDLDAAGLQTSGAEAVFISSNDGTGTLTNVGANITGGNHC